MNIGILDADLLDNGTRHPNLALMKISGFLKEKGHKVELVSSYDTIEQYEKIYLSRVFNFTNIPEGILTKENSFAGSKESDYLLKGKNTSKKKIVFGGTGFIREGKYKKNSDIPFFLPDIIEHHMPDYSLYEDYINSLIDSGKKAIHYIDYLKFSIGFSTRGCFRRCKFCVNQHYSQVNVHSPIKEFYDPSRPFIYLWDDNFLGLGLSTRKIDRKNGIKEPWEKILDQLDETKKPFQFRQGLDLRLMDEKIAERLLSSKYYGDYIFAFDHLKDKAIIEKNLSIWRKYSGTKIPKLYVLCGFDSQDEKDIAGTFERIKVLMKYGSLPYIMRFEKYKDSKYKGIYTQLARWCNQPQFLKKKSFRQFCEANQDYHKGKGICSAYKVMIDFEKDFPEIAREYFDLRWDQLNMYL